MEQITKVGVGVMIFKEGKILTGMRRGADAAGEYSLPGGRLEHLESFEGCARREVLEEHGITIKNVRFLFLANLKKYAPKHYAHIGLVADWESGEPRILEPDKCEDLAWRDPDALPPNTDITLQMALESHRTGKNFFDA